jgi:hypothetical protein
MTQKIQATDITEEEAQNAVFFERTDEFIKLANDFCRPEKGQKPKPAELRGQVSAAMLLQLLALIHGLLPTILKMAMKCVMPKIKLCLT